MSPAHKRPQVAKVDSGAIDRRSTQRHREPYAHTFRHVRARCRRPKQCSRRGPSSGNTIAPSGGRRINALRSSPPILAEKRAGTLKFALPE